jgi:hypothetical protein
VITMRSKSILMATAAVLIVGTCLLADEQANLINYQKQVGPDADFSQKADENERDYTHHLTELGEADAMIYFAGHKDMKSRDAMDIGTAHAYKHHLIGTAAYMYAAGFLTAIDALTAKE